MIPSKPPLMRPTREVIGALAREAGELSLRFFRRTLDVSEKAGNQGLVTDADLACEEFLREQIAKLFPGHAILGEEGGWGALPFPFADPGVTDTRDFSALALRREHVAGTHGASEPSPALGVWILDPIDGTTNFSNGNPHYCVSVGFGVLEARHFKLLAAAIAHPPAGDVYTAIRGEGTEVLNRAPGSAALRCKVNPNTNFSRASFATGFSTHKGESLRRVVRTIAQVQDKSIGLRVGGAAALDLAYTARGILHGFYESALKPWDLAAGVLLVEEAGGKVTNFRDEPFDLLSDDNVVCANASLHAELLAEVRWALDDRNEVWLRPGV